MENIFALFNTDLKKFNQRLAIACELALKTQEVTTYRDGTKQTQGQLSQVAVDNSSFFEIYSLYSCIGNAINAFRTGNEIEHLWCFVNKTPKTIEENVFHDHPGYDVSGVYYVDIPPNCGGNIEFKEPQLVLEPYEGLLVLFQSDYWHRVMPLSCDENIFRYSIAFNCRFKKTKT